MNVRAVHFPLMDSIRAIALLAVIAAHTSYFIALNANHVFQHVRFDFSVRVFFMISAFLLYHPFVRARFRGELAPSVKAFAWRRLLRIIPAYWVALTLVTIWLSLPEVFSSAGVPTYYGLIQIYRPHSISGGLPQAWSVSVELAFYAMLPAYAAVMRRRPTRGSRTQLRQELACAAVLFAVSAAFKVSIAAAGTVHQRDLAFLQSNPLAFLDDFALGMSLASISAFYESRDDQPRTLRILDRWPGLAWGIGLVALVIVSTQLGLTGQLGEPVGAAQYVERHYLFTVVALGLVLPAMFGNPTRGLVRRLLGNRVLLYLGMISYAVYLYHFAVLTQLQHWDFTSLAHSTSSWIWYPAALGGGVLLATISYYVVERPFLRLKRLVPAYPEPKAGEALAEPAPIVPARPGTR